MAQDVQLDIQAQKSLQDAVVQVPGDAAALGLDGAGAQMAHQKYVFKRWPDVPHNLLQPSQIAARKFPVRFLRVDQQDAARGASTRFDRHG